MKKLITKNGNIQKYGGREDIFSHELCDTIRERLSLTEEQLPDKIIKKQIKLSNQLMGRFIVENPEGFMLKDMGIIAPSKHLPKEFRENKEETIDKIKTLDISELRRQQILKRYDVDIGRRIDYHKLQEIGELLPHLNLSTYYYTYRIMWFNHRNTKAKKARIYEFKPSRQINDYFADKIWSGKDYYELSFDIFYQKKLKAVY